MSVEEHILFRKSKNLNGEIGVCYRLAESVIAMSETDFTVYSLIISEICDGTISNEAIFMNVSESKALAIQIFDTLSENLVLPCFASEILDEIYERLL